MPVAPSTLLLTIILEFRLFGWRKAFILSSISVDYYLLLSFALSDLLSCCCIIREIRLDNFLFY